MDSIKKIIITHELNGQRVDKALANHPDFGSRSRVSYLIEKNLLCVNEQPIKPSYILKENDVLTYQLPPNKKSSGIKPFNLPLTIVYEDSDLIVINKPSGLVVHPASGHPDDTLVNALIHHTSDLSMKFGEDRPGIVHRLDRDTSGLLVIAKNDYSHEFLAKQFKNKTAHRKYFALVYGQLHPRQGMMTSFLARHPRDRKKFASVMAKNKKIIRDPAPPPSHGKWAVTHYFTLSTSAFFSYLELKLETGRTHQIRVHLSEIGHSIVGDVLYQSDRKKRNLPEPIKAKVSELNRFLLHAGELGFAHPRTGELISFQVPWPEDVQSVIEQIHFSQLDSGAPSSGSFPPSY